MKPETKVGIMATSALILLTIFIFMVGRLSFWHGGYTVNVLFSFVNNIKTDAKVLYAGGVGIGKVQALKSEGDLVKVVLAIDPGVKIRKDADITIYSQGLLGEKYVEINVPTRQAGVGYLENNAEVRGNDPVSGDETMVTLHKIADVLRGVIGDPQMKEALIRTVRNAGTSMQNLNDILEGNKAAIHNGMKNFSQASETLNSLAKNLGTLISNLNDLTSATNKEQIQKAISNLGTITSQLEQTSKSLSSITQKIDRGEGTVGALVSDKQLADDIKSLVADLKKNPWKLLWKK